MLVRRFLSALALVWAVGAVAAETAGESLLQSVPPGYKVALSKRQGQMAMTEMIPLAEDIDHWTEMVTTQVFIGGIPGATPESFFQALDTVWKKSCPKAEANLLHSGEENGYPVAFWTMTCPTGKDVTKSEYTRFKAIQGKDSFYLVQKAWKAMPPEDAIDQWTEYLRGISVCDSRKTQCANLQAQAAPAPETHPPRTARKSPRRQETAVVARAVVARAVPPKPPARPKNKADARACLDYEDNAEVIRCAERYR